MVNYRRNDANESSNVNQCKIKIEIKNKTNITQKTPLGVFLFYQFLWV